MTVHSPTFINQLVKKEEGQERGVLQEGGGTYRDINTAFYLVLSI